MSFLLHNLTPHLDCHVETIFQKQVRPEQLNGAVRVFLVVWGMGCPHCALRVRNSLLRMDGVLEVQVHLERGLAQVLFDPATVLPDRFPAAVAAAGGDEFHRYLAQLLA